MTEAGGSLHPEWEEQATLPCSTGSNGDPGPFKGPNHCPDGLTLQPSASHCRQPFRKAQGRRGTVRTQGPLGVTDGPHGAGRLGTADGDSLGHRLPAPSLLNLQIPLSTRWPGRCLLKSCPGPAHH